MLRATRASSETNVVLSAIFMFLSFTFLVIIVQSRYIFNFSLREVTWEDLAFFNADLFEGLSRMILDGTHPLMTPERFQATYCCHFEVNIRHKHHSN